MKSKPASKFNPTREDNIPITIENIESINNKFWEQESVSLYKCYKNGNVYSNNSKKKTSINLIQDMIRLLGEQYKSNSSGTQEHDIIIENIINNLKLLDILDTGVDKNCILSIIQGYTLGCLNNYEKNN